MCGIAGFNFKVDEKKVSKSLFHRGPDEQRNFEDDILTLIHTRLAIQDIKDGHQPFFYQNYIIVFNGEIYNHKALREELKKFNFKTSSDTETLLYLYLKFGKSSFFKIDGMFAFAIYDKNRKKLILARDRAGKKPLYYYLKDKRFAFASELNALTFLPLTLDEEEIKFYLSTGMCETPYKEIKEVDPGTILEVDLKDLRINKERFFDIYGFYQKPKIKDFNEALFLVDEALEVSVKNRLISSDVEVGAFLSGGIDSSLIVAKASGLQTIKTFTVRFEGSFDESHLASLVAQKYDTDHQVIDIKMDVKDNIEKILLNYGKPFFDSSAIPSFFVSQAAREYVKVVLNGDGADELFGGYRRYVPYANGWDKIARNFSFFSSFLHPQRRGVQMFLYRLIEASKKSGINWYNALLNDIDIFHLQGEKLSQIDKIIRSLSMNNFEKLLYLDFIFNLRYGLLVKMDIATMTNSLEARSPFLSRHFLELAPQIDKKFKVKGIKTKYILRKLAQKYLPKELVGAKKRGFEIPLVDWVNGELREVMMDYLAYGFYKNFLDAKEVQKIIERKRDIPEEKRAKFIYLLFALEVWYNGRKERKWL